jgi:hypothetical protein
MNDVTRWTGMLSPSANQRIFMKATGSTEPRPDWLARVDAALVALRRAVRFAVEHDGDTRRLDEQAATLREARFAELQGNSRAADRLLAQALNGMDGDE